MDWGAARKQEVKSSISETTKRSGLVAGWVDLGVPTKAQLVPLEEESWERTTPSIEE